MQGLQVWPTGLQHSNPKSSLFAGAEEKSKREPYRVDGAAAASAAGARPRVVVGAADGGARLVDVIVAALSPDQP